ncbi:NAD(P)-binding protein [Fusarium austroafricanum]|uniref:NAD(P)-binding protein n=1 Tax=Fusarium austroafricanum TaxID=2364996 RepID=A0A8H4JXG3_9HYPO|nr:NAD(P)-binding protein [Fusarium austroafricanum]
MAAFFNISPEKRASQLHFYYRQLFVTPPLVSRHVVNLEGKTAIVTGASSGVGLETARQLLDLGCKIILTVRDEVKGKKALQDLSSDRDRPPGFIEIWKLDLLSYDSILDFTKRAEYLERLDIVILNAGVHRVVEEFTADGYEQMVQVNYLSTMLLIVLLLPILKAKRRDQPGRICFLSSDMASWAKFNERDEKPLLSAFKQRMPTWDLMDRYSTTKLLGQLFLMELSKHVSPSDVIVSCANPGPCGDSNLAREFPGFLYAGYVVLAFLFSRKSSIGARTIVNAVTTVGKESHGQYIEDAKVQPMAPIAYKPEGQRLSKQLYDETLDEFSEFSARNIINSLSRSR